MKKVASLFILSFVFMSFTTAFAVTYTEIAEANKDMTKAQFNNYKAKLKGSSVTWEGTVTDVQERKGAYVVFVRPDGHYCAVIGLYVPPKIALKINRDEHIKFSGKISRIFVDDRYQVDVEFNNVKILERKPKEDSETDESLPDVPAPPNK